MIVPMGDERDSSAPTSGCSAPLFQQVGFVPFGPLSGPLETKLVSQKSLLSEQLTTKPKKSATTFCCSVEGGDAAEMSTSDLDEALDSVELDSHRGGQDDYTNSRPINIRRDR